MRGLVVLACIVALLASATLAVGCVLEDSSPQTPREVVVDYLDELATGDTNTAWDMLSSKSQELFDSEAEFESLVSRTLPNAEELESVQVVKTSIKGDVATVTFTTEADGKKNTDTVELVKEDGVWKVSL